MEADVEAVPQDRFCDTVERDDCAVDFFNFSTRLDRGPDEELEFADAHPKGMELPLLEVGAGRDG